MKAKFLIIGALGLFTTGAIVHHASGDKQGCPLKQMLKSEKSAKVEAVK